MTTEDPLNPAVAPPAALTPLSADEHDAQDDVLDALREHQPSTPQWEFCDGFLTALVCTRRRIEPEEYWPLLLGDDFVPAQQMEFVWRFKRRWQQVESALDNDEVDSLADERCLMPACADLRGVVAAMPADTPDRPALNELPAFGQVWAAGFFNVLDLWPEEWQPPRDKELAQLLDDALDGLEALLADDRDPPTLSMNGEDEPPSLSQARLDAFGEAIWAVYELRQIWRSLGPRGQPRVKEDLPGRNDPCFCGSGRKYKKCHGALAE